MKKCKFCQEELAEDSTLCPHCGKDNTAQELPGEAPVTDERPEAPAGEEPVREEVPAEEASEEKAPGQIKAGAKASPAMIAIAVAAVVVLLAALIALVATGLKDNQTAPAESTAAGETTEAPVIATVPADGNPDDVTCKGTYTVTDEDAKAAKDTVVATIGDAQLTNGQLQVYYWNMVNTYLNSDYGYYMMMYGMLDYTQPLDTQMCVEDSTLTWQQYFLREALGYWQMYLGLANEAQNAGLEMTQEDREYLDNLPQSLEETAKNYDMADVEELLVHNVGPGASLEDFLRFQELFYMGKPYYLAQTEAFVPTQEELEAFFAENEEAYAQSGVTKDSKYVDVRHILMTVEGGTTDENGTTTYSDEEWEACRLKAQEILDQWLAGDMTEDSFAALATEKTQDPGSQSTGGLYENVTVGQMVEPFENWCFDEGRQVGDYGLVQTSYGYHVMYFVGSSPIWEEYAKSDWTSQQINEMIEDLADANPMDIDYGAIKLGFIDLAG